MLKTYQLSNATVSHTKLVQQLNHICITMIKLKRKKFIMRVMNVVEIKSYLIKLNKTSPLKIQ